MRYLADSPQFYNFSILLYSPQSWSCVLLRAAGHAEQWGSVSRKKDKKGAAGTATPPSFPRGGDGAYHGTGRGARGDRDGFSSSTRGGGRGGRGGGRGGARGGGGRIGGTRERDNSNNADYKNSGTGAGSVAADASSTALDWGEPNPVDTSGWGESANFIAPAAANDGWSEAAPEVSMSTEPESKIELAIPASAAIANGTPPAQKPSPVPAPAPNPITSKSSRVPPGAKLSWAQITRCVFGGRY